MSVRSRHTSKSAARRSANEWKKKGYKVFIEHPYYKGEKVLNIFIVTTEGHGSKKIPGKIYDLTQKKKYRFVDHTGKAKKKDDPWGWVHNL